MAKSQQSGDEERRRAMAPLIAALNRAEKATTSWDALLAMWELGVLILDLYDGEAAHGSKFFERLSHDVPRNQDTLRKVMVIAKEYSPKQIEALCRSLKRANSTFGFSSFVILVTVKNRADRAALVASAISGSWSTSRVRTVVTSYHAKQRGKCATRGNGRKPNIPEAMDERLVALIASLNTYTRWRQIVADDLPVKVLASLVTTDEAVLNSLEEARLALEDLHSNARQETEDTP